MEADLQQPTTGNDKSVILIIDDEPMVRQTLEALLTAPDVELAFAENGSQGLELAQGLLPNTILLDVMMPGMDGYEVCERLRAHPLLAETPIIMLTALDSPKAKLQGLEAGADEFLTKPFDGLELRIRLKTATRLDQLRRQAKETAVLQERARLARELHDSVNQTLFSAAFVAAALPDLWERDQEEAWRRLHELKLLNQRALAEMRMLLIELRPAILVEKSLPELLEQLLAPTKTHSDLQCDLETKGFHLLPDDVQIALFRIAQEAVNNVVKHANATQVHLLLHFQDDAVLLRIEDNGKGFDASKDSPKARGFGSMRERAALIGAILSIESAPASGTVITVVWPFGEES